MRGLLNEDVDVLAETAGAIRRLQGTMGIPYADLFAPLRDDALRAALRRLTIHARGEPLGAHDLEAVSPPVFGRYALLYSTDVDARRQGFALRHGMGHVACGHVTEVTYLSDRNDHMLRVERVADLFALADLVPAHLIDSLRDAGASWRAIGDAATVAIREHTSHWPEPRVRDRARMRVTLFRVHGL